MGSVDAPGRACVASATGGGISSRQLLSERVDRFVTSITFRPSGGRFVFGCMRVPGEVAGARHAWCGHVVGEIRGGRLVDPRLDIACRTATGAAVGSAWIEPVDGARWIVVRGRNLIQVYPVPTRRNALPLPVRVTTLAVDTTSATAVFRIEQYNSDGARVSEATLRAAVAG